MTQTLDLAPIGNCAISALIDRQGRYLWACAPRVHDQKGFLKVLWQEPAGQRSND